MSVRNCARPGVTLTEVLVALFVMALGLIALFTLFPLGAMQLGQALKDDRTAQTAAQADGFMRAYWRDEVVRTNTDPGLSGVASAFDNPSLVTNGGNPLVLGPWTTPAPNEPSYPVLVDPLGFLSRTSGTPEQTWVARASSPYGTAALTLVPRRNLVVFPNTFQGKSLATQSCTLLDDMTFTANGAPTNALERQGRYNWAAVLQRPKNGDKAKATLTVLVFDGRVNGLPPPAGDETIVPGVAMTVGSRSVSLTLLPRSGGDQAPLVRKGGWLLDGTIDTVSVPAVRNANFYRIAGVTEAPGLNGATNYVLDLETPIKGPVSPLGAQVYFFAGLSEVFERPLLQPDPNVQP